jgi:hypothetical protein
LVIYNVTSKASLSAFGGVIQDDYNRPGGTNSPTPLNFLTGSSATTGPYYLYGILKDISYNYGFGVDYSFSKEVSLFAEYSHEHYYRRMISRSRTPESGGPPSVPNMDNGCGPNSGGFANRGACDSANNDWESTTPEPVDIWTVGADTHLSKKVYFTTYYSLSAGRANTFSRFLGDPVGHPYLPLANDPDRFTLVGTSAAVSYPETTTRQHEVVAVFKYKLSKHLWPKIEYRYQQFDNRDAQTSMMTQYMGCVSPTPISFPTVSPAVAGCPIQVVNNGTIPNPILSTVPVPPPPNSAPNPTPFYPRFVVGDNSAARYLFLGVDQPSYRAHYLAATMEYHF